jgi:hypothetical protein
MDLSMTGFGRRCDKGKAHSIRDSELGKNRAPAQSATDDNQQRTNKTK